MSAILPKDSLMEELDNVSHEEILRRDKKAKKIELDSKRDNELKGFVISNVFMNENIIRTMAVQHNIATDDEVIEWIDINNQTVTFNKVDFGALIISGSQKVKEIYFKYRALKDDLIAV